MQRLALRKDQCLSHPHRGAHHLEEQPGEAHPAGGERAALRTGPQLQGQLQEEACPEKPLEEAHPVQNTETPPPAGLGPRTVRTITTTIIDHRRNTRHRTAPRQQEEEPTSIQPAPPAPRKNEEKQT